MRSLPHEIQSQQAPRRTTWQRRIVRLSLALGLERLAARITAQRPAILVAHRFRNDDGGAPGGLHIDDLRLTLDWIRRHRDYEIVDLEDLFTTGNGSRRKRVAFTIDDGYADQVDVAGPVFEAFDCPVTVFLTTGFLDGETWMWWDRVEYAIRRSPVRGAVSGLPVSLRLDSESDRTDAIARLIAAMKAMPDAMRRQLVADLATVFEVDVPARAPDAYAPLSWQRVQAAEARGLYRFGPHTLTHPILARTTDDVAREEIAGSWHRVRSQLQRAMPVLAVPNGLEGDYGEREIRLAHEAGLKGVLSSQSGRPPIVNDTRFAVLSRHGHDDDFTNLRQALSGIEDIKHDFRSRFLQGESG